MYSPDKFDQDNSENMGWTRSYPDVFLGLDKDAMKLIGHVTLDPDIDARVKRDKPQAKSFLGIIRERKAPTKRFNRRRMLPTASERESRLCDDHDLLEQVQFSIDDIAYRVEVLNSGKVVEGHDLNILIRYLQAAVRGLVAAHRKPRD
jgi:hypothetical protein